MKTYYNVYYKRNGLSYLVAKAVSEQEAKAIISDWESIGVQAYAVGW